MSRIYTRTRNFGKKKIRVLQILQTRNFLIGDMPMKIIDDTLKFFEDFTQNECEGNLREAARRLGLSYTTLYDWLKTKRRVPTLKALEPVLSKLNVSLTFPNTRLLDYEFLPVGTAMLNKEGVVELLPSPRAPWPMEKGWLISQAIHPEASILVDVRDDTMHPLLRPGDLALIDQADREIKGGEVYLLSLCGDLALRRLVRSPSGLIIHAENATYPAVPVGTQEYQALTIHGRLRWAGKLF
jgi:transcriptional regulator with XRE-family HTH domain